jgi:hypothetical protein
MARLTHHSLPQLAKQTPGSRGIRDRARLCRPQLGQLDSEPTCSFARWPVTAPAADTIACHAIEPTASHRAQLPGWGVLANVYPSDLAKRVHHRQGPETASKIGRLFGLLHWWLDCNAPDAFGWSYERGSVSCPCLCKRLQPRTSASGCRRRASRNDVGWQSWSNSGDASGPRRDRHGKGSWP